MPRTPMLVAPTMQASHPLLLLLPALLAGCAWLPQPTTEEPASTPPPVEDVATPSPDPRVSELGSDEIEVHEDTPVVFGLEGTQCLGTCPVFKMRLSSDGSAVYRGELHAPREGWFEARVDPAELRALAREALAAGYFELAPMYMRSVTDNPFTYSYVRIGEQRWAVMTYATAPPELEGLEDAISALGASLDWTPLEQRPSGPVWGYTRGFLPWLEHGDDLDEALQASPSESRTPATAPNGRPRVEPRGERVVPRASQLLLDPESERAFLIDEESGAGIDVFRFEEEAAEARPERRLEAGGEMLLDKATRRLYALGPDSLSVYDVDDLERIEQRLLPTPRSELVSLEIVPGRTLSRTSHGLALDPEGARLLVLRDGGLHALPLAEGAPLERLHLEGLPEDEEILEIVYNPDSDILHSLSRERSAGRDASLRRWRHELAGKRLVSREPPGPSRTIASQGATTVVLRWEDGEQRYEIESERIDVWQDPPEREPTFHAMTSDERWQLVEIGREVAMDAGPRLVSLQGCGLLAIDPASLQLRGAAGTSLSSLDGLDGESGLAVSARRRGEKLMLGGLGVQSTISPGMTDCLRGGSIVSDSTSPDAPRFAPSLYGGLLYAGGQPEWAWEGLVEDGAPPRIRRIQVRSKDDGATFVLASSGPSIFEGLTTLRFGPGAPSRHWVSDGAIWEYRALEGEQLGLTLFMGPDEAPWLFAYSEEETESAAGSTMETVFWASEDLGRSWMRRGTVLPPGHSPPGPCALRVAAGDPEPIALLSCYHRLPALEDSEIRSSLLLRSEDGGRTWREIQAADVLEGPEAASLRGEQLFVGGGAQVPETYLVTRELPEQGRWKVQRSDDLGVTWSWAGWLPQSVAMSSIGEDGLVRDAAAPTGQPLEERLLPLEEWDPTVPTLAPIGSAAAPATP